MRLALFVSFLIIVNVTHGQFFEWEPKETDPVQMKKHGVKSMKFEVSYSGHLAKTEFYSFDQNGYISLIVDSIKEEGLSGAEVDIYRTDLDSSGSLRHQLYTKQSIIKNQEISFAYDESGRLVREQGWYLFYGYLIPEDVSHIYGAQMQEPLEEGPRALILYNKKDSPDTVRYFVIKNSVQSPISVTTIDYFHNGQKQRETTLSPTGDTITHFTYNHAGKITSQFVMATNSTLPRHHKASSSQQPEEPTILLRSYFKHSNNRVIEENLKVEVRLPYFDPENSDKKTNNSANHVLKYTYNKDGELIKITLGSYHQQFSYVKRKDQTLRYRIFESDTIETVRTIVSENDSIRTTTITKGWLNLGKSWLERSHLMAFNTEVETTEIFSRQGLLKSRTQVDIRTEERCETNYQYLGDRTVIIEQCQHTSEVEQNPPKSLVRVTKYFVEGRIVRETTETKGYVRDEKVSLLDEQEFSYTKDGKLAWKTYKVFLDGKEGASIWKYRYHNDKLVSSHLHGLNEEVPKVSESHHYTYHDSGKLRQKDIIYFDKQKGEVKKEETWYYGSAERRQRIVSKQMYNGEPWNVEVLETYDERGLRIRQFMKGPRETKTIRFTYGF